MTRKQSIVFEEKHIATLREFSHGGKFNLSKAVRGLIEFHEAKKGKGATTTKILSIAELILQEQKDLHTYLKKSMERV